jgi:hypothetical protein
MGKIHTMEYTKMMIAMGESRTEEEDKIYILMTVPEGDVGHNNPIQVWCLETIRSHLG